MKAFVHNGFKTGNAITPENKAIILDRLFKRLKLMNAFGQGTTLKDFHEIFDGSITGVQINWIRTKGELAFFIKSLLDYEIIEGAIWKVSAPIFLLNRKKIAYEENIKSLIKDVAATNKKVILELFK